MKVKRSYKKKKRNYTKNIVIFFLFSFILYMAFTNITLLKRKNQLAYQYADLQEVVNITGKRNAELQEENAIIYDKDYQEKLLREKGMYKKEGEGVIVIKELEEQEKEEKEKEEDISFVDKIINSIKKLWK